MSAEPGLMEEDTVEAAASRPNGDRLSPPPYSSWSELQQLAKGKYESTPLPDRTNEDWHYGDARKFDVADLSVTRHEVAQASVPVWDEQVARFMSPTLNPTQPGTAVPPLLADHFAAQHFAISTSPQVIHLNKNEAAGERHIHLYAPTGGSAEAHTLLLTAEPFSSADIYIHISGGDAEQRNLHSVMLLADIGDGAHVKVTRVQHYGARTDALLREYASVGRDAQYTSAVVQLGGLNVRSESHATLAAPGSAAHLRGAYLATGRQRFDFLTHQNHQAPHASSNLLYKGALLGRSRASYQGMITVAEDAQRTDAYQSNRALVLSGSARADSSPQLEIGANDVRCTHGSTVSNVSATELFYMQSRGIPREVARRLLVHAFIAEVTDQIACEGVRSQVESYVRELAG